MKKSLPTAVGKTEFFPPGKSFLNNNQWSSTNRWIGGHRNDFKTYHRYIWKALEKHDQSPVLPDPPKYLVLCLSIPKDVPAYHKVSACGFISVLKLDESESGQMVSEKVKLTYFDVYLSHTMWNPTKNSMKGLKQPTSVFLQWEVADWQELFAKNAPNKGN